MIRRITRRFERAVGLVVNVALDLGKSGGSNDLFPPPTFSKVQEQPNGSSINSVEVAPPAPKQPEEQVEKQPEQINSEPATFEEQAAKIIRLWLARVRPLMNSDGTFSTEIQVNEVLYSYNKEILQHEINDGKEAEGPLHRLAWKNQEVEKLLRRAHQSDKAMRDKRGWYIQRTLDSLTANWAENDDPFTAAGKCIRTIQKFVVRGRANGTIVGLEDGNPVYDQKLLSGKLEELFLGNVECLEHLAKAEAFSGRKVEFTVRFERKSKKYREARRQALTLTSEELSQTILEVRGLMSQAWNSQDAKKNPLDERVVDVLRVVDREIVCHPANDDGQIERAFIADEAAVDRLWKVYEAIKKLPSNRRPKRIRWRTPEAKQCFKGKSPKGNSSTSKVDERVQRVKSAFNSGEMERYHRRLAQAKNDFPDFNWDKLDADLREEKRRKEEKAREQAKNSRKKNKKKDGQAA